MELPKPISNHPRVASFVATLLLLATLAPLWNLFSIEPLVPTLIQSIKGISLEWVPFIVIPLALALLVLIWLNTTTASEGTITAEARHQALEEFQRNLRGRGIVVAPSVPATPTPDMPLPGVKVTWGLGTNREVYLYIDNVGEKPIYQCYVVLASVLFWSEKQKNFITFSGFDKRIGIEEIGTIDPDTPKRVRIVSLAGKSRSAFQVPTIFKTEQGRVSYDIPLPRLGIYQFDIEIVSTEKKTRRTYTKTIYVDFEADEPPKFVDRPKSASQ